MLQEFKHDWRVLVISHSKVFQLYYKHPQAYVIYYHIQVNDSCKRLSNFQVN